MIDFLKGLLSSDKIIDAGVSAGDKLIYTKEEKADDSSKADDMRLKFVEASLPMERARRFMAITVTIAWVVNGGICMLAALVEIALQWYAIYHPEFQHPDIFKPLADFGLWYVAPVFGTVTGFYFWKRIKQP
jgi:hypothetical protein